MRCAPHVNMVAAKHARATVCRAHWVHLPAHAAHPSQLTPNALLLAATLHRTFRAATSKELTTCRPRYVGPGAAPAQHTGEFWVRRGEGGAGPPPHREPLGAFLFFGERQGPANPLKRLLALRCYGTRPCPPPPQFPSWVRCSGKSWTASSTASSKVRPPSARISYHGFGAL